MTSVALLFAPALIAAIVLGSGLVTRERGITVVGILSSSLQLVLSILLLQAHLTGSLDPWASEPFEWLTVPGGLSLSFGTLLDAKSVTLVFVVSLVAWCVNLFSSEYLHGDPGLRRYYALLGVFSCSMLGLVLATDLVQLFICWELVGLVSYYLVGFWFQKKAASKASAKALLTNRVGDFGFMLGIILVWYVTGTTEFAKLSSALAYHASDTVIEFAALLIFCGVISKSAQVPLHIWLPDAMEGPTPVSALIHAATMVAAGVYLLVRTSWLWAASPVAAEVVMFTGAATSLFAALIAIGQRDLKRVLAFSTVSQLGYMVMAVGASLPSESLFHLTTHAFFKALLFLSAGSIIHAMHHEQDIWNMGGLWKKLPITFAVFTAGSLALCGVIPFSGYYSKEAIILGMHGGPAQVMAIVTAALTPFYVTRTWCITFLGSPRVAHDHPPHEASWKMLLPLIVLAVFALVSGWSFVVPSWVGMAEGAHHDGALPIVLTVLPLAGIAVGWFIYGRKQVTTEPLQSPVYRVIENRFYIDELYANTVLKLQEGLAILITAFERPVFQVGPIASARWLGDRFARTVSLVHTGNVDSYVVTFCVSMALLIALLTQV
jgi:NADH-quinone oxidoreductase subunit L